MIITMIFLSGLIYLFNLDLLPSYGITDIPVMGILWCLRYFWIVSIYNRVTISVLNSDTIEGFLMIYNIFFSSVFVKALIVWGK